MRQWIAVAIVILFMSGPAPAGGQESPHGDESIMTDPEGDAGMQTAGGSGIQDPVPSAVDLRAFGIDETEESLIFNLYVAALGPAAQVSGVGTGQIDVDFQLGRITRANPASVDSDDGDNPDQVPRDLFRMEIEHWDGGASAALSTFDWTLNEYISHYHACSDRTCDGDIEVDAENARWRIHIPREALQDQDGITPNPFVPLHQFLFTSSSDVILNHDVMPNDGVPGGLFTPKLGFQEQFGDLRLSSTVPVRWSNGEERSYVFHVMLENLGPEAHEVSLHATELPAGWVVNLPAETLQITGLSQTFMPVLLDAPFSHEHGEFEGFILQALSSSDPDALGQVELGIRYSTIPQPTGHHPRVWIHAEGEGSSGGTVSAPSGGSQRTTATKFMSAMAPEDQPGSTDAWIHRDEYVEYTGGHESRWNIPLKPSLKLGLDFNLTETGTMEMTFASSNGMDASFIDGGLYYRASKHWGDSTERQESDVLLASIESIDTAELPANQPTALRATLVPTQDSEYIRYDPDGAFVFLELRLLTKNGPSDRSDALLIPGGTMDLPLDEYHDDIADVYQPLNEVIFVPQQEEVLMVNPGKSRVFEYELLNQGPANQRLGLTLTGPSKHWGTILDETVFDVASDGKHMVRVLVTAPGSAWDGSRAGPLLQAISQTDPRSAAEVRSIVEVDVDDSHPDESHLLPLLSAGEANKGIPSAPIGLAGALVLMAALATRRIRRI